MAHHDTCLPSRGSASIEAMASRRAQITTQKKEGLAIGSTCSTHHLTLKLVSIALFTRLAPRWQPNTNKAVLSSCCEISKAHFLPMDHIARRTVSTVNDDQSMDDTRRRRRGLISIDTIPGTRKGHRNHFRHLLAPGQHLGVSLFIR